MTAQRITFTNLSALRDTFPEGTDRAPARQPSIVFPHLKRCLTAGLIALDGPDIVLTDAGREALGRPVSTAQ
jgi:hypothetical protein